MAKRRMISQELIYDENYNSLSLEAQLLFIRLLVVSDDFGFIPANEYTLVTLTNPHQKIKKNIYKYLTEITDNKLGFIFEYGGVKFFSLKRDTFDLYQSYLINKRTKSEYLKLSKDEIDSEKFQEILGNYSEVISNDIESIKIKVKSIKKKDKSIKEKQEILVNHPLQKWVNENCLEVSKLENQLTEPECEKLLGEFSSIDIKEVLLAMDNYKPLLKKYKSVNLTLRNWIKNRNNNGTDKKDHGRGSIDVDKYAAEREASKPRSAGLVPDTIPKRI